MTVGLLRIFCGHPYNLVEPYPVASNRDRKVPLFSANLTQYNKHHMPGGNY